MITGVGAGDGAGVGAGDGDGDGAGDGAGAGAGAIWTGEEEDISSRLGITTVCSSVGVGAAGTVVVSEL